MVNRTRPMYEAARHGRWLLTEIGRELRVARHATGLRQADVARLTGTSKSRICRVEHGAVATLSVAALARHGAAVGLKPSVRLWPLGRRLLDAPQLELLARFRRRLHPSWTWQTEVPMPLASDLRSGDCRITVPRCAILVEAYTPLLRLAGPDRVRGSQEARPWRRSTHPPDRRHPRQPSRGGRGRCDGRRLLPALDQAHDGRPRRRP